MQIATASRLRVVVVGLALLIATVAGCTGYATPGAGRPEFPLVACPFEGPAARLAPPGHTLVAPGTIAFGSNMGLRNVSGSDETCGAQAVRDAETTISFSSLGGEDRIFWVATLARPGNLTTPDPILPTMTLLRLDPEGPVVVDTATQEPATEYSMRGQYGHDARPGAYLMRIVSASGDLLAEGRFEIVE